MNLSVPIPRRMQSLPVDPKRGVPVPWFVVWLDEAGEPCAAGKGTPDFRVVRPNGIAVAHTHQLCWVCGERRGTFSAFVIGPMCAVNRVSSEPPSHLECADFSARACPFLSQPKMRRREKDMPAGKAEPAGFAIKRNPGATLVWVTKKYTPFRAGNGVLFDVGEPHEVRWYCEGRTATRAEVLASIESGLPLLRDMCEKEPGGPSAIAGAHAQLDGYVKRAMPLLPAEAP